ncbi:MAG TPA: type II secretion system F family protein [Conexibacter sp.]|nr:type II secretion system F family protein [Conexibacter sp.]
MSGALLAALAAALGVLALWDLLAAAEALARGRRLGALADVLAPLVRARRAGVEPSAPERRRLALTATLALLAAGWFVAGALAGAVMAVAGPWALGVLVRRRRRRYRSELERAAPAVARAVADALAAGHSISRSLGEAARGVDGAAAVELRAIAAGLVLGQSLERALARLQARAGSRAYDTLATAILLQRDAGGDLVGLLRELARGQEAAARCADDARAATAQARFTGLVVGILPAGAAVLAELASPGALAAVLRVPLAVWLAIFAAFLQLLGLLAIRRLGRVA